MSLEPSVRCLANRSEIKAIVMSGSDDEDVEVNDAAELDRVVDHALALAVWNSGYAQTPKTASTNPFFDYMDLERSGKSRRHTQTPDGATIFMMF